MDWNLTSDIKPDMYDADVLLLIANVPIVSTRPETTRNLIDMSEYWCYINLPNRGDSDAES